MKLGTGTIRFLKSKILTLVKPNITMNNILDKPLFKEYLSFKKEE